MDRYLYVFESGEMFVAKEAPTDEDLLCVEAGILTVIDMQDGTQVDAGGHWTMLEKARMETNPESGNEYHTF